MTYDEYLNPPEYDDEMPTNDEIVFALRCSSTPGGCECKEGCPYRRYDEVIERLGIPADYTDKNGKKYWVGCDSDQIMQDAAEALEKYA